LFLNRIPIGVACTGAFGYLWAYALDQPGTVSHYQGAVWCYALSVFIELLAEPLWVVSQLFLFVRLKVCLIQLHTFSPFTLKRNTILWILLETT